MKGQKRIGDYGIIIGKMKPGSRNAITDVYGVKVFASCHVINGFGKSIGLVQIEELGTIESPIILTNTLSIGVACDALIEYTISNNSDIGIKTGTVNPIICECNDAYLNDIRGGHVKRKHIFEAISSADDEFAEGSVGAGTGMSCYQLKGGIGTASREVNLNSGVYTVGVLVLTNYGLLEDLLINGKESGKIINSLSKSGDHNNDGGSVIIIIATDIPLTERQLNRIAKRAVIGINKTGSNFGSDSGDIVISFSTANTFEHYDEKDFIGINQLNEKYMDDVFRAVVEGTEEAVLNSLICADTTYGRDGHMRRSLKDFLGKVLDEE